MAELRRNDDDRRYELWDGDERVGIALYHDRGSRRLFVHTEMAEDRQGEGFGGELVRGALDDTREAGRSVLPLCPFVAGWIDRHEEYAADVDLEAMARLDE